MHFVKIFYAAVGDEVAEDELVMEIETDKVLSQLTINLIV